MKRLIVSSDSDGLLMYGRNSSKVSLTAGAALEKRELRTFQTGRKYAFAVLKNGRSAAYSLDVGNLRDSGHSVGATPPAAMADQQKCTLISRPTACCPTSAAQ